MKLRMQPPTHQRCRSRGGSGLLAMFASAVLLSQLTLAPAQAQGPRGNALTSQQTARRAVLVDIEEEGRQQNPQLDEGNHFQLTAEQLDYWVFNNTYEMARENHQALIKLEIAQLDATCGLTAEQQRLLQVAGAGELQRLTNFRAVLQARYADRTYDQNKLGEVYQELQPYQRQFQRRGLDSASLLLKLLPAILDEAQTARFAAWQQERQRVEQRAQIDAAIADIEQQVPLTIAQRERLIELFQTHTRPVATAAAAQHISPSIGRLAQLNDVSPEAFQAFLEPPQWEALQTVVLSRRGYLRMLRDQNLLLDPLPPPAQADAVADEAAADSRVQESSQ